MFSTLHVPTLERMYHKRLKGYSELGYQVKFGGQDSNTSIIYGSQDFVTPFTQDLSDAARSILIVSPHIHPNKVSRLLSILEAAVSTGVSVAIYTKAAESYASERQAIITAALNLLEATGASVFSQEDIPHHYAIIDESVVWYGNIDFLAFGRKDADVLRFENADIAGELLELLVEKEAFDKRRFSSSSKSHGFKPYLCRQARIQPSRIKCRETTSRFSQP